MLPETVGDAVAGTIIATAPMPAKMAVRMVDPLMEFPLQVAVTQYQ